MPDDTSVFTQAVLNVVKRRNQMKEDALRERGAVSFMEERVDLREARAQWEKMGPEQKRAYIGQHGVEAALRLVRPPRGFSDAQEG